MYDIEPKVRTICNNLHGLLERDVEFLDGIEYIDNCDYKKGNAFPESGWEPFLKGTRISGKDKHVWLRGKFKTGEEHEGMEYQFCFKTNMDENGIPANTPQSILFLNGKVIQGLDCNHFKVPLLPDTEYEWYIYFFTSVFEDDTTDIVPLIIELDKRIEKTYYDLLVPFKALEFLKEYDPNKITILKHLEIASNLIPMRSLRSDEFYEGLKKASKYLKEEFYEKECGKSDRTVSCVGHTHIDVAWLWTLRQTVEKAQRSFATATRLMEEYDDYIFFSSQPQLYEYVKEEAPETYEKIKKRIKEGRWEAEGGMWLEADCNLTSGESLVRQMIKGKKFMKDEFGVDNRVLWLPDIFGYSAALPQIMKKSGIEYFVTTKLGWNDTNKIPYDTFLWEGMDGSAVKSYFVSSQEFSGFENPLNPSNYGVQVSPSTILGTFARHQQKELGTDNMLLFGYSDGGGGPTKTDLEMFRRVKYGLPGFPKAVMSNASDFLDRHFKEVEQNSKIYGTMPRWVGELYLEFHRGTYTSIAKNKRNNRKSEFLMQSAELLSSIDTIFGGKYPKEELDRIWKKVLVNQFHDIIPGSSITLVYEDSDRDYADVLTSGEKIRDGVLSKLATLVSKKGLLVFNPLGFERDGVVEVDGKTVTVKGIASMGWKVVDPEDIRNSVKVSKTAIENDFFTVSFGKNYEITSIFDKRLGRELIKDGECANRMTVYEDFPSSYDAWEISSYYNRKKWYADDVSSVEIVDNGAKKGIKVSRKYLNSTITQTVFLYDDIDRIDFDTEADWHEQHQLLRVEFPFYVHTNSADFDIQFGNISRSTHRNTSWDAARFEVNAQKWVDVSEDGYGVSLMNDCKYGYSVLGGNVGISLIKCATDPDPVADQGYHKFTYSVYSHKGGFKEGGTVRAGYDLNQPLVCVKTEGGNGTVPDSFSFVSCDSENIVVETVKAAENGDGKIIRLFDAFNRKSTPTLKFGIDIKEAYVCDLLENELERLKVENNTVTLPVGNYEIITLKIK